MAELDNFRAKYPGYDDLDDATLGNMLAEKYPDSYGDLSSSVVQEPATTTIGAPNTQDILDMYQSGSMNENQLSAFDELAKRGVVDRRQKRRAEAVGGLKKFAGLPEAAVSVATGAIAEPIAGLAGIAGAILPGEEGQGKRWIENVRKTQQTLFQPVTDVGKEAIGVIGGAMEPIGKGVAAAEKGLGDFVFDITGSPTAAAAATTVPAAILEILGLKGTRSAKRIATRKLANKIDVSDLYDDAGDLLPEIKQAFDDAGINLQELDDIIPEVKADIVPEDQLRGQAKEIGDTATSTVGQGKKSLKIAEEAKPSKEILNAAEELGVADIMLGSHLSQNPTYIAIEQGLKSIPGSQMAVTEKALISELAKKADDLITEFGGTVDKAGLSDDFRAASTKLTDDLTEQASRAYDNVAESIPQGVEVSASNTVEMLTQKAKELGGVKYLDKKAQQLLNSLDPKSKPTYARLDTLRKQIGAAIKKNTGPFADADAGTLKQLYKSLAEDQKTVAKTHGVGDLYETANKLTVGRKIIEDQLTDILGKELRGSITAKARPAMLALQKGDTKAFDSLIANLPEGLPKEMRKSVIVTALNDAFVQGSRMERSLNIAGFDDFMTGLNRNSTAKTRLTKEIGKDAMKRLDTLHTVVGGVRNAQKSAISTGLITAVPGMFDEAGSLASRLYGTGKKIAAAEGVSTLVGLPGAGTAGVIGTMMAAKKTVRSAAADALLNSPAFNKILRQKASGSLDSAGKIARAEKALEKIKSFQKWKAILAKDELTDMATVGTLGYLTGEEQREE